MIVCLSVSKGFSMEEEAKKGDLFEEAKANAEKDIDQLFKVSLGDEYNVVIEWRSAE